MQFVYKQNNDCNNNTMLQNIKIFLKYLLSAKGRAYLKAQRLGLFDASFYHMMYPEISKTGLCPIEHYRRKGWKEKKNPSPHFNTAYYMKTYPEVQQKKMNPLVHYVTYGRKNGLLPLPDKDLCNAPQDNATSSPAFMSSVDEAAYIKAISTGVFDHNYYAATNPDVAKASLSPIHHFSQYGWRELRNPSKKFDICWYTQKYLKSDYSKNALLHYILEGQDQGHLTSPPVPVVFKKPLSYADRADPLRRICLFAGYDVDGLIDDYVIEYLTELSKFCDIYYLSASQMRLGELDKLNGIVKNSWAIEHDAYDFGSWALLAREYVGWNVIDTYDELLLANDSCYLVRSLDNIFATMDTRECDWWGLQATKGVAATFKQQALPEVIPLQEIKKSHLGSFENDTLYDFLVGSYFLTFRKPVIDHQDFRHILNTVTPEKNKLRIIRKYEIGLTRFLISEGFEFSTFIEDVYPHQPIFTETVFELIAQGFPFFKRYLLAENHYQIPNLEFWKEKLHAAGISKNLSIYEKNALRVCGHDKLYISFYPDQKPHPAATIKKLDEQTPKYNHWWAFPVCCHNSLFTDNIRALFEFVKNDRSIKKIVLTRKKEIHVSGKNIVVIPLYSKEGQYYLLRSRYIFLKHSVGVNIGMPFSAKLHNFINLWHGIPLKRIGQVSLDFQDQSKRSHNAKQNELLKSVICASNVDRLAMTSAYWPLTYHDMWLTGLPRHDFITQEFDQLPTHLQDQACALEKCLEGRKLILFAPTFRNDHKDAYYAFSNDEVKLLSDFLDQNNLVLGVREHMADKARQYTSRLIGKNFLNLSEQFYPDIEVIYRYTAVLITDYSSAFIDFLLTKRPVISYAYDYEQYTLEERGLFYDLTWAFPGAIATTFDELLSALHNSLNIISTAQQELYEFKSNIFLKYFDSNNRQRVYEKVLETYTTNITTFDITKKKLTPYHKSILWIYGPLSLISARYRVFNLVPEFEKYGWKCKTIKSTEVSEADFATAAVIVLSRTPCTEKIIDLCEAARLAGCTIIADIDDLFFDERFLSMSEYFVERPDQWAKLKSECNAYRRSLELADYITVSTRTIKEHIENILQLPTSVMPNSISTKLFEKYKDSKHVTNDSIVRLCYLSGSKTHRNDFAICSYALKNIMAAHDNVEVHIVGNIAFDETLDQSCRDGFISHPGMTYENMHEFLHTMDINLAPLTNTVFNDAKSELKIFEAALHRVPTIASPTCSYADSIQHGKNGLLVSTELQWKECIEALVHDVDKRLQLGQQAFVDLVPFFSAKRIANEYASLLKDLLF